ncbi:MAG: hypothetical protein L6416_03700 [Candidatus Omnitrophica bacterium]|nr:hypothetical protein [Candidatus Omnitrophota bacterium]
MEQNNIKTAIEHDFNFLIDEFCFNGGKWEETNFNWTIAYKNKYIAIEVQIDLRDPFVFILVSSIETSDTPDEMKYLEGKKKYLQDILKQLGLINCVEDKDIQTLGGKWENIPRISHKLSSLLKNNLEIILKEKEKIF